MAVHDYHKDLPGYDERQILVDGCGECATRGADFTVAMAHLDDVRFARAWRRAAQWMRDKASEKTGPISKAETMLLRNLWSVQVLLERTRGIPTGTIPDRGLTHVYGIGCGPIVDATEPEYDTTVLGEIPEGIPPHQFGYCEVCLKGYRWDMDAARWVELERSKS